MGPQRVVRATLVSGAVAVAVAVSAGAVGAEPSRSHKSTVHELSCDGADMAVVHTPGGSGPSWTVESGGTADMNHARWIDVRGYEGDYTTEPAIDPVFHLQQSFGNRRGHGDGRVCSLVDTVTIDGGTFTIFADAEIVTRER